MREIIRDKGRLEHMLEAIANIMEFTKDVSFDDFMSNKILRFAVVKNIEIIGEASYKLSKAFREANKEIEWEAIIGLRACIGAWLLSDTRRKVMENNSKRLVAFTNANTNII